MPYAQSQIAVASTLAMQAYTPHYTPISPAATKPKPEVDEAQLVADYLSACALVAHAEEKKEEARQAILDSGLQVLRGLLNKLTVTQVAGRTSTDVKAILQDGLLTQEQISKYQKTSAPSMRIYVSALS